MKEWKGKTGANSNRAWDNYCKNINCAMNDIHSHRRCSDGRNHRTCPDALKFKRGGKLK